MGALVRGLGTLVTGGDPRTELAGVLEQEYGGHVTLCSSGTDALTRALKLADDMSGSSHIVALPAYGCFDLATAAVGAETRVILYDLDPATLAPDLASLRKALEHGAKAVVCAPYYGLAVDWAEVAALAKEFDAIVIEDAAQAIGARWRGHSVGSLGDISVFSFGRGKGWTGSHGGALLARGAAAEALRSRAPSLLRGALPARNGVMEVMTASAQHVLGRPNVYALPASIPWLALGETRYREPSPSAEMSRAAAAMLLASRARALREVPARRQTAAWYHAQVSVSGIATPVLTPSGHEPGYLRFPVRVRGGFSALPDRRRARALGIAPAYPSLLNALRPIRDRLVWEQPLSGAAAIQRELVTLPTHSLLTTEERADIVALLAAARDPRVAPATHAQENLGVAAGAGIDAAGGA